jgi:hypothetical protein
MYDSFCQIYQGFLYIKILFLYTLSLFYNPNTDKLKSLEQQSQTVKTPYEVAWQEFRPYIQPIKISAAITLTAIFVVHDNLKKYDLTQNGLWATAAVCLIRQESSSSSFLTGYQRLEGTVVGALFGFAVVQFLECPQGNTNLCISQYKIPILILWTAVCIFFKDGARHGYAATVAALTPIVLIMGPQAKTPDAAWRRVMMTFVGILFYLVIDLTIFPNRTDRTVRRNLVGCLDQIITSFSTGVDGVKFLLSYVQTRNSVTEMLISDKLDYISRKSIFSSEFDELKNISDKYAIVETLKLDMEKCDSSLKISQESLKNVSKLVKVMEAALKLVKNY